MERTDDTGASALEYGLMLAAITALIAAAVFHWGSAVGDLFSNSDTTFHSCIDSDGLSC
jgi:Flp pilus assembly pilin Flp